MEEKVDIIVTELLRIRRATDSAEREGILHEFVYSLMKFSREHPDKSTEEIIALAKKDWKMPNGENFQSSN